jgi:hypothetical protein
MQYNTTPSPPTSAAAKDASSASLAVWSLAEDLLLLLPAVAASKGPASLLQAELGSISHAAAGTTTEVEIVGTAALEIDAADCAEAPSRAPQLMLRWWWCGVTTRASPKSPKKHSRVWRSKNTFSSFTSRW